MRTLALLLALAAPFALAAPLTREQVLTDTLKPYAGPSEKGVDVSTMTGKVMCGYQGWFNCDGDGAERGWVHWTKKGGMPPSPDNVKVDLWPDVSEYGADELFATDFKLKDGSPAKVFSSYKPATVLRHFQWMKNYGIDGAFVQRFAGGLRDPRVLRHNNTVLASCREGANRFGRAYAVMYDLSGLGANKIEQVTEDWQLLHQRMKITDDPAYLHHNGRPVVTVWGVGFNDKRQYTLDDCRALIEFLKADGCTVMIGVPTYWRDLKNDAIHDPKLHEVMKTADVISPWTVGRFRTVEEVARHAERLWAPDLAWCVKAKREYMPVVFPGFSWHNMYPASPTEQIPRQGGKFLWAQYYHAQHVGCTMVYQAMFDEVDEGTAVFKCTNEPPTGAPFVTYEGLPSDHYLKLVGAAGRMLRGELKLTDVLPELSKP